MNRILRRFVFPSLAVLGALVALPSVARADDFRDRGRSEHERFEHERAERERRERFERERREREHRLFCVRAYEAGASRHRLREMGCYVR